jgi:DNA-binding transcriptional MerR regulator
MRTPESLWTIAELGAQVALALTQDYGGQANGQVRAVPDGRSIRYYTTLGLIDRPAAMTGRTALYSQRHLLQLVAIKRLQAKGLSLAEIQQELLGLPDSALRKIAQVPHAPARMEKSTPRSRAEATSAAAARPSFWADTPAPVPETSARTDTRNVPEKGVERAGDGGIASLEETPSPGPAVPLQGIVLDEDVTLLLRPCRALDEKDVQAIRIVAAPLLKLLEKRRLTQPRAEREHP